MAGSMMRQAISEPRRSKSSSRWPASLKGTTSMYLAASFTIPLETGALAGPLPPAHHIGIGDHGEHHGVVVAVVGALDLADHVAPGGRAGHPDGIHGGLGARIGEAHHLEMEPAGDLLSEGHGRLGGHREVGASGGRLTDRLDDPRMGVAHQHRAEATVEVEILAAVLVPDVAALTPAQIHGIGLHLLKRGGHAEGQNPGRAVEQPGRPVVRARSRVISASPIWRARASRRSLAPARGREGGAHGQPS